MFTHIMHMCACAHTHTHMHTHTHAHTYTHTHTHTHACMHRLTPSRTETNRLYKTYLESHTPCDGMWGFWFRTCTVTFVFDGIVGLGLTWAGAVMIECWQAELVVIFSGLAQWLGSGQGKGYSQLCQVKRDLQPKSIMGHLLGMVLLSSTVVLLLVKY